jgi:hypothetical protein
MLTLGNFLVGIHLINQSVLNYVIGRNRFAEVRRELMQEYPNNPFLKTIKCVLYVGLTYTKEKLLVCDHNTNFIGCP